MVAHALTLPGANVLPAPIPVATLELKLTRRPHSPLFARLASDYLAAGRVADARTLCASGIEMYPRYATGHIVFAQCHALAGDLPSALASIERARVILPDSDGLRRMASEWETKLRAKPAIGSRHITTTREAVEVQPEPAVREAAWTDVETPADHQPGTQTDPSVVAGDSPADPSAILSPLTGGASADVAPVHQTGAPGGPLLPQPDPVAAAEAASQRLAAAMSALPPLAPAETADDITVSPLDDDGRIVSKTLAEIYAGQGAFGEAIITYRLLRRQKPERAAECDARIAELEKLRAERRPATSAR